MIIRKNGDVSEVQIKEQLERTACSFERIYFSRGTDKDIYLERKKLGELICEKVLEEIDNDFTKTIFSFIPNTAESAYFGMMQGMEDALNKLKTKQIQALGATPDQEKLAEILSVRPRFEKLAVKDAKLRTFIADDNSRGLNGASYL